MDIQLVKAKMLRGEPYDANTPELLTELTAVKNILQKFNHLKPENRSKQRRLLQKILGKTGNNFTFIQPFYCDYGKHIEIGEDFFANFNLTILNEAKVVIGDHAFIGPNVNIYTACHSLDFVERNKKTEWAEAVHIGNNVWIGGSTTICPGVNIGNNVVIGAGSVVVKDIPNNCVAVGNPCHIVKTLPYHE